MSLDKNIEELLDKYFNGETSLEEELQLQTFFQGEGIPVNLKAYRSQFKDLKASAEITAETFTEEKLFAKLDAKLKEEKPEAKVVTMTTNQVWFYRIAAAVALILVGYFVGNGLKSGDSMKDELLGEMRSIMFDQFSSESASGRLQAVNNSLNFEEADDEILEALIQRMTNDKNINVRLKAVESLSRFGQDKKVKTALVDALGAIEEPAIQIALINVLVELKEKTAIENLEKITQEYGNLKEVRDEAHLGIFKLKDL